MNARTPSALPGTKFQTFVGKCAVPVLVVLVVFGLYLVKPDNLQTSDPVWAPHLTASLIYDRDTFLDEYREWIEQANYYAAIKVNDRLESFFPIGGPLLTVPQTLILDAVLPQLRDTTLHAFLLTTRPGDPAVLQIQLINAAWLVALSAGVIYLISRESLSPAYALIATAIYAFGTSAYSTASRSMWQHGPSMLMLSLGLLVLIKARRRPRLIALAGLPVAAAYIMRPTNVISVVIITLYVLICYRQYFIRYLLMASLLALPFVLANFNLYGHWLPPYYSANRLALSATFGEALAGNLFSPARGLFVFSPILLMLPVGVAIKVSRRQWLPLDWAILVILALHWLVISTFPHWWAGHSFGPRFFADVLPYAIYFLLPVLESAQSPQTPARVRGFLGCLVGLLAIVSIGIHFRGATSVSTTGWNTVPLNVDVHPERLWDWADPQFLRGLGSELIAVSPDEIDVVPGSSGQSSFFEIGKLIDDPVDLTIYLPGRISLAEHSAWLFDLSPLPSGGQLGRLREPLSVFTPWRYDVEIDATHITTGDSLNAIEIVASTAKSDSAIITESKVVAITAGENANLGVTVPRDIQIECTAGTTGALSALYGAGWYDLESAGDASWRWSSSPARLFVWSDVRQPVSVALTLSAIHAPGASDGIGDEGLFHIVLPNGEQINVEGQTAQLLHFDASLESGWNTLVIELEAGSFRPADLIPGHFDTRDLAFSIDDITLAGACAVLPE